MRKDKDKDLWILASEAAEIISVNSGHPVTSDYVRLIARTKPHMLRHKAKNGNVSLYFKPDVENIKVKRRRVAGKQTETNSPLEDVA